MASCSLASSNNICRHRHSSLQNPWSPLYMYTSLLALSSLRQREQAVKKLPHGPRRWRAAAGGSRTTCCFRTMCECGGGAGVMWCRLC